MLSLKVLKISIFVAIGALMVFASVTILPIAEGSSIPPISLLDAQQEFPIIPSITLTVCLEGPPTCDFKKIQDAINAAPETPPVRSWKEKPVIPLIKIAPGTYEENLIVLKSLWLQGAGRERTTVIGKLEGLDAQHPTIFVAGSWHIAVGITNLTIAGNHEAIQVVGRVSGMIVDNFIRAQGETRVGGIWLTGAVGHLLIAQNTIMSGMNGIVLHSVVGVADLDSPFTFLPGYGVFIVENDIQDFHFKDLSGGYGVTLHNAAKIWIAANHIHNNDTGIFLNESKTIKIESNTLEENGSSAIWSWQSTSIDIRQNMITRNGGSGIELWSGSSINNVESNTIVSNNQDGIRSDYRPLPDLPLEIQFLRMNRIEHNQRYGINLDPQVIKLRCEANQVSSNKKGDYSSEELRAKCGG
ncbi:MAG: right-handed parallel beta-helix repeat-containing protein [Candidatus Caldarchaeum sp.]